MLTSLVFLQQENVKKSKNLMKIDNIEEENLYIFWASSEVFLILSTFNDIFGKDVTSDNVKSHKQGHNLFSEKHAFRKTKGKVGLIDTKDILESKVFQSKDYDVINFVHDVAN